MRAQCHLLAPAEAGPLDPPLTSLRRASFSPLTSPFASPRARLSLTRARLSLTRARLRFKFAAAVLKAVSRLNYADGPGHAKIAKIAKACIRTKLDDDCSQFGRAASKGAPLPLRRMVDLWGGDHDHMRGVARLAVRLVAKDMAEGPGKDGILRCMRASSLLAEIASQVYMSHTTVAQAPERAEQMMQDLAAAFFPCANMNRNGVAAAAHYRALSVILKCARDAGGTRPLRRADSPSLSSRTTTIFSWYRFISCIEFRWLTRARPPQFGTMPSLRAQVALGAGPGRRFLGLPRWRRSTAP